MKKLLTYIGIGFTTLLTGGGIAYAVGVTIPQSTSPGQMIVATTSGNYTYTDQLRFSTTTGSLSSPVFAATSTTATSTFQAGLFQNTVGDVNNNKILDIQDVSRKVSPDLNGDEVGVNVNIAPRPSGSISVSGPNTFYGTKVLVDTTGNNGIEALASSIGSYVNTKSLNIQDGSLNSYGFYGRLQNLVFGSSVQNLFGLYLNLDGTTGSSYGTYITGEKNDYLSGNLGVGSTSPYAKLGVNGQAAADYFTGISDTPSTFKYASTSQTSADVVYSPKIIFGKDNNGNNEQIVSGGDRIRIEAEGQDAFIELNPLNGDVYTQCCDFTSDGLMHGIVDGNDGSTFILNVPGGNIKHGTLTKTVSYTASIGDDIIFVNGLTKTITLPTAVGNIGHSFLVKLVTNSTSTVNTTSSQTIDGSLTYPLTELNKYVQVVSNGANWWVIGDNSSLLGASASAGYFTATSTTASVFPYASTTALSATTLCLTGDTCRTTWPVGSGSVYPFQGVNNSTSTLTGFTNGVYATASSTVGDGTQIGGLTANGGATTTGNQYISANLSIGTPVHKNILDINGTTVIGSSYAGFSSGPTNGLAVQGNIGINSTGATSKLSINGSATTHAEDMIKMTNVEDTTSDTWGIDFVTLNHDKAYIGALNLNGSTASGGLQLDTVTSGGTRTEAMRIDNSQKVMIGTTVASSLLSVNGTVTGNLFTATSTTAASTLPYASSTVASASTLCISTDCRTTWPSGSISYDFALTGNATSTLTQFNGGLTAYASTTIGDGTLGLTVNGPATTTGKAVGTDVTNSYTGRISPTHGLVLSSGTTTSWTASTTGSAYSPFVIAPFGGTVKDARCGTDASFLGVNIKVNGSSVTPSYFVASTTIGFISVSAGNTFTAGQKISADFGTTTTSSAFQISCTVDVIETL